MELAKILMEKEGHLGVADVLRHCLTNYYVKHYVKGKVVYETNADKKKPEFPNLEGLTNMQICELLGGRVEGSSCQIVFLGMDDPQNPARVKKGYPISDMKKVYKESVENGALMMGYKVETPLG